MADVFISYARVNKAYAGATGLEKVFKNLAPEITYWRDNEISGGTEWNTEIREALQSARCIVVIWSRDSWASYWVRQEAFYAYMQGKLLPLCIDDVVLEPPFNSIQSFKNDQKGYEALVAAIRRRLSQ